MKARWLVLLGVAAFLIFAIVTLPASLLLGFFKDTGLTAAGVEGTVWKGRAQVVQIEGVNLGALEWDLHALALLALRLQADVRLARNDGFAQTQLTLRSSRSVGLRDLTASLPLSSLANLAPSGWSGTVNLKFARLELVDGWPSEAAGTAEILNVSSASGRSPLSGSYKVTFPANTASNENVLTGALSDLGGPLQIAGTVELRPERGYLLQGLVAPRPDAPNNLAQQLQILGPPDAQGRYPFSIEGSM